MTATHYGLVQNGRVDRTLLRCDALDFLPTLTTEGVVYMVQACEAAVYIDADAIFLEMYPNQEDGRKLQLEAALKGGHWTEVSISGAMQHYCEKHTPRPGGEVVDAATFYTPKKPEGVVRWIQEKGD